MDPLKKVSLQTFWQLGGKAVTSLSGIFILGLITRTYGKEGTGVFTLSLTYLAFFYTLADLGINAHLLPKILQNDWLTWRKLLGFRVLWATFLIAVSFLVVGVWPVAGLFRQAALIGSGAILASAIFTTANAAFQSRLLLQKSVLANSAGTLAALLSIYIITAAHFPVSLTLLGHFLGWLVTAGLALFLLHRFVYLKPEVDLTFIQQTIRESWPISLTLILNMAYFRVDAFLLLADKGFSEVGIYNVAYQIFQSALVLPTFIMNGYYPLLLQHFQQNHMLFKYYLKKAILIMLGLSLAGVATTEVLSPLIIDLITGSPTFSGAKTSLQILALGFPAFFISAVFMWVLITLRRYKIMLVIYVTGLIFNSLLNYLLIPRHSFIASSWITGASEYLILGMQIMVLWRIKVKSESERI